MIPDATEEDYERDADEDYALCQDAGDGLQRLVMGSTLALWVRRAVTAEKRADILNNQFDEAWRHAQALIKALAQGA